MISFCNNIDDLIKSLTDEVNFMKSRIDYLSSENSKLKSSNYKDEELSKMKEELERMRESYHLGFPITPEQSEKIKEWKNDWFKRKRNGDKYLGAIGGGFTYRFVPTGIGTSGVIVAPDGEEYEFQEID